MLKELDPPDTLSIFIKAMKQIHITDYLFEGDKTTTEHEAAIVKMFMMSPEWMEKNIELISINDFGLYDARDEYDFSYKPVVRIILDKYRRTREIATMEDFKGIDPELIDMLNAVELTDEDIEMYRNEYINWKQFLVVCRVMNWTKDYISGGKFTESTLSTMIRKINKATNDYRLWTE